ncbi:MAG TPA: ATP-dependent zinc metalloprotease FtsH [Verrucomicrobiae bacterium]|jgi:cell division protease FtsH
MFDEDDNNKKDNRGQKKPPGGLNFQSFTWVAWIIIIGGIMAFFVFKSRYEVPGQKLTSQEFWQKYDANPRLIAQGTIHYNLESSALADISGTFYTMGTNGIVKDATGKPVVTQFATQIALTEALNNKLVPPDGIMDADQTNGAMAQLGYQLLFFVGLGVLFWFFFIRQIKIAGKGALSFGKSKARLLAKDRNKITFKEVAGVDEAIEEVSELVEFLKDPKKFQKLGGRIPKGVLMVGPPGTGKTLLAKAIAGEADASFFSISGSDFVEMFVGVGASRVRDMFEQARRNTPCLIFIDEIDAVGRHRGHGLGGGNDEREQTLNALLVEMDGFDTQEGIIIIAATNRQDVLDPALLRPGRFDRQVTVNLPDVRGREGILKVHAKNVKLEPNTDLSIIARGTPGYSGAELANLLNEAALLAARLGKKAVGMSELEEARDKVRWGRERRSMAMSDEEKRATAWHEAGHALVSVLLEHTHPLHKVTIIPRGRALGVTMSLPKEDMLNMRRKQAIDTIIMTMGGRIGEQFVTNDISSGASMDIQQATQLAKAMVMHWGMSDKLGNVLYGDNPEYVFLGRDMMTRAKDYSEQTAQEIDAEVKRIIEEANDSAKKLINDHRDKLEIIANALLEYETLDGTQVDEIIRTGKFTPPPKTPSELGPMMGAPAGTPLPENPPKQVPPKLPGLSSPSPAPA